MIIAVFNNCLTSVYYLAHNSTESSHKYSFIKASIVRLSNYKTIGGGCCQEYVRFLYDILSIICHSGVYPIET